LKPRQNGDDGHDNEEFDQGKPAAPRFRGTFRCDALIRHSAGEVRAGGAGVGAVLAEVFPGVMLLVRTGLRVTVQEGGVEALPVPGDRGAGRKILGELRKVGSPLYGDGLHYGSAAPQVFEFLALISRTIRDNPGHSNCNGHLREWGLSREVGLEGIEIFKRAMEAADSPQERARVEKASVDAYRLALGEYFKNEKPVPADEREANRDLARTLFHLTDTHNVAEYFEGRRMEGAKQNIRKALGMADDEAF